MNPHPTASFLAKFYAGEYWKLTNSRRDFRNRAVRQLRRGVVYARLLRKWHDTIRGGKILEIGSGLGGVVWSLGRRFGAAAYANEPDPEAQELLQRLGVGLVSEESLSRVGGQNSYDLVILSHVLEHQPDPKPLLELALRQVSPGGLLLIEVPNGDVIADGGIEHPLVFSRRALSALLRNYDCVVRWKTHDGPERVFFPPQYLTAIVKLAPPAPALPRLFPPHLLVEMRRRFFMRARGWGPLKGLDFRLSFWRRRAVTAELAMLERDLFTKLDA